MPPFVWPDQSLERVQSFEGRYTNPEAGALLVNAFATVETLHYLRDLDALDDLSQSSIRGFSPLLLDIAHARWGAGSCCTALDLCAAALGRVFCKTAPNREYHIPSLLKVSTKLPALASAWLGQVNADSRYQQTKAARDSLTHARLSRHFSVPRKRLKLSVGAQEVDVPTLIATATAAATEHVSALLDVLPSI